MESQHRNAVGIDHVRVDLAVGVFVRNHLSTAGEVHRRAVETAIVVLERLPVAADAVEPLDAAHDAEARRRSLAAAEFDVIPAREIERLVVQPPRHVEVRAAGAVLVVRHAVFHLRDVTADPQAGRIGEVAADDAAGIRQAIGKAARLRIEQQPGRLARAGREHDDARTDGVVAAIGSVDVGHAAREPAVVGEHLARHGVWNDAQLAGGQCGRQQHRRRRKVGMRRAPASALSAVVARRPAVERLRENRQAIGDARDLQPVGGLLDQQFVAPRLRRRLKHTVGFVWNAFHRPEDPDQAIELVVIRLDVVVGHRPVIAETVEAAPLEIVGSHPQRDAAPVVRAPAEHPATKPIELRACRLRIRLAVDLPAADAAVEFAERSGRRGRAAPR